MLNRIDNIRNCGVAEKSAPTGFLLSDINV